MSQDHRSIQVKAPSNIALIKYMGKKDGGKNYGTNASLSLTLDHLCTYVEAESLGEGLTEFQFLSGIPGFLKDEKNLKYPAIFTEITEKVQDRMIRFLQEVQSKMIETLRKFDFEISVPEKIRFRTSNTFPMGVGVASSASSFAGVTTAVTALHAKDIKSFKSRWKSESALRAEVAMISRLGSGSSCRSFFGPLVEWNEHGIVQRDLFTEFHHFLVMLDESFKKVSSSEAHTRVRTSPKWKGRVERAEKRLQTVREGLAKEQIREVSREVWDEFMDMHTLFHTSDPSFSYWMPGFEKILEKLKPWYYREFPPLITMDAGPNLHFFVPEQVSELFRQKIQMTFPDSKILEDQLSKGVKFV